jgi:hypothetical protein
MGQEISHERSGKMFDLLAESRPCQQEEGLLSFKEKGNAQLR